MLGTTSDQTFALIVTADGMLEIELGARFSDADIDLTVASARAVAEALDHRN
jgi:hypothetical protein